MQFDGFECSGQAKTETQTIPAHKRNKWASIGENTIRLPEDLPVETAVIDMLEEEKICKETGASLHKIGEEIGYKLALPNAS